MSQSTLSFSPAQLVFTRISGYGLSFAKRLVAVLAAPNNTRDVLRCTLEQSGINSAPIAEPRYEQNCIINPCRERNSGLITIQVLKLLTLISFTIEHSRSFVYTTHSQCQPKQTSNSMTSRTSSPSKAKSPW